MRIPDYENKVTLSTRPERVQRTSRVLKSITGDWVQSEVVYRLIDGKWYPVAINQTKIDSANNGGADNGGGESEVKHAGN